MPYVVSYAVISAVGTAAYCLLWIDFAWPVLNALWLVAIPLAGFVLGIKLRREGVDPTQRPVLLAHALVCIGVAAYTTVWGALTYVMTRDLPPRPAGAVLISLLPLLFFSVLIVRPIGTLQKVAFTVATVGVLLPSLAVTALWGVGSVLLFRVDPGPVVFEQTLQSPSAPVLARLEVRRWSGGIFPDTQGRVWLEIPGLPLRQLVYRYWTDRGWHLPPGGVVQWKSPRFLEFTLPSDSHGGRTAPLAGIRIRCTREED